MSTASAVVPVGYKQTEIGVFPKDWDVVNIDSIASVKTGAKDTQDKIDDGDFPFFVRSQNVERINSFSFDGEAVLTAGDGVGTGKIFHYIMGKFDYHQRVYCISDFFECTGKYFYYQFSSRFHDRITSMTAKSSVDSVRRAMITEMLIPLPKEIKEQNKISAALSESDILIERLESLVAKKRDIKQSTIQELLTGKTRLPGFSDEWQTKLLGDSATLKARIGWQGLTTAEYMKSGEYLLVGGTEFNQGFIDWSLCHHVEKIRYDQDRNIQLRTDDVLVTKDGTIGKVALVKDAPKLATLNSGVFVIRPKQRSFNPVFFYYLLLSRVFEEFLDRLVAGSTINHLYQKDFVNFEFDLPPMIEEQEAIAEVLSDMDAEITALEERLEKARAIKQGMMQQLLTGKIRLVD